MYRHITYWLAIVIVLAYSVLGIAQVSYHIGEAEGLSVKVLIDVRKDRSGTMWLGSYDGLFRHEGARIRNLSASTAMHKVVGRSEFHTIFEDSHGYLWAGSLIGFYCIHPSSLDIRHFFLNPKDDQTQSVGAIYAIFEDKASNIWLSTDVGMYIFDRKNEVAEQIPFSVDSLGIPDGVTGYKTGVKTKEGLWFHTKSGLVCYNEATGHFEHKFYNPRNFRALDLDQNPGIGAASYVIEDKDQSFWFISNHRLLTRYHPGSDRLDTFPMPLDKNVWTCCQTIALDGTQGVWIGFRHGGLLYFDRSNHTFTSVMHKDANSLISSNYINALEIDDTGKLWVGSNEGIDVIDWHFKGLSRQTLSQSPDFKNLKYAHGNMTISPDNKMYIPFSNFGYFVRENNSGDLKKHEDVSVAKTGTGFVLPYKGQLYCERNGGLELLFPSNGKSENHLFDKFNNSVRKYPGKIVWIECLNDGFFALKKSSGKILIYKDGAIQEEIQGYAFSRNFSLSKEPGRFWYIGSGMNLMRKNYIDHVTDTFFIIKKLKPTNFYHTNPRDIIDDGRSVWITSQNGVLRFFPQKDSIAFYTTENGLSNSFSFALVLDLKNRLWVSNLRGIDRYDEALQRFVNVINWPLESYMDAFGSGILGQDGIVHFSVGNKLFSIDPEQLINGDPMPKRLMINLLSVNGAIKPMDGHPNFILNHRENNIFIQYSLVDFSNQDKFKYYYRFSKESDWILNPGRGELMFNALQPGKYSLELGVSTDWESDLVDVIDLTLIIKPPFWQTWWFRLLILLIVMVLVYLFYRYRLERALEVERVRNKIAADLHDDVASTVSSISYYSEFAKTKVDPENIPLLKTLDQIGENARESLDTMRDVIWSTQSRFDHLKALKDKIQSTAKSLCQSRDIELIYSDNLKEDYISLPPLLRRNIYLIVKESVANAVRHAACISLTLELKLNYKKLTIIIADNGHGFDLNNARQGNGLENIQSRAKDINGVIQIRSNSSTGTMIQLEVELENI